MIIPAIIIPAFMILFPFLDDNVELKIVVGVSIICLYIAALMIFLEIHHYQVLEKTSNGFLELSNFLNNLNQITAVKKSDMYKELEKLAFDAKRSIRLMYTSEKPPDYKQGLSEEQGKFYDAVKEKILGQHVEVIRIIRLSEDNTEWIKEEIISKCINHESFSLHIFEVAKYDLISVQIFDDSKVVLTNLGNSKSKSDVGIVINSENTNSLFDAYYKRLLGKSKILIDKGEIKEENYKALFKSEFDDEFNSDGSFKKL